MAAPTGNTNAVKHGLRATNLLSTGSLPRGAGYIKRITNELRAAIESAVSEAKGEVCLHDSAVAQTAIRWERHALLAQKWLRLETDNLTPDQRLAFSRDIARASAERDKCLRELGLNIKPNSDPWAVLDVVPSARQTVANETDGNGGASHADASGDAPVAPVCDGNNAGGQPGHEATSRVLSDSEQPDTASPVEGLAD